MVDIKKSIYFVTAIVCFSLNAKAQSTPPAWDYLNLTQPSKYLVIQLGKQHENFMDGQAYVAEINNISTHVVHVTGSVVAYLTCGNQVSSDFDVTLDPGKSAGGGSPALLNMDGLGGHAMNTDCLGEKKYPDPNDTKRYYLDRIKTVGISNLQVKVIDDETEPRVTDNTNNSGDKTNSEETNSYPNNRPANGSGQTRTTQAARNFVSPTYNSNTETTAQAYSDLASDVGELFALFTSHSNNSNTYQPNFPEILDQAKTGDVASAQQVACIYYLGKYGAPKDEKQAFKWFYVSAKKNSTLSEYFLGLFYLQGIGGIYANYEEARKWFMEVISANAPQAPDAAYFLGVMSESGYGASPDIPEAITWYKMALTSKSYHSRAKKALRALNNAGYN